MLANATSILALVALLVAAVAVAYSALTRTTIATLKESNGALTERVGIVEFVCEHRANWLGVTLGQNY